MKVAGAVPTSTATWTAARFLRGANRIMSSKVVPVVERLREGYYSYDFDSTIVDGTSYRIPTRAVAGKLENAAFLNGTYRLDAIRYFENELDDTTVAPAGPGFYVKRNSCFVLPSDGAGWPTFRQSVLLRPNKIIDVDDAAQITAIDTVTKVVTFTTVPSTWANTDTFDMVQAEPHFDWLGIDLAATTVVTGALGTITFTAALPDDLAVGDWVSLAGETPVVQCPVELHPWFAQLIANDYMKSKGDKEGLEEGRIEAKELLSNAVTLLTPRVEQAGKKVTNRTGILRRGL